MVLYVQEQHLTLSTPVVAGATYSWTGPNGFTSTSRTPSIANVDPTDAGTYNVTITVSGCTSAAGSTTVVVNPLPATPTATNNGPLCVGATLNLSTPVVAGATYSWTGPNGFTSAVRTPSITNVTVAAAGTYNVTITVSGCTSAAGSTTVVVNPLPATPTATNNGPLCTGATLNLSTPVVAGATYSWTGPNGFTSTSRTPSITNVDPTDAGTYSVTITVGGCTSAAGSTTVVVNPLPATPTATNNGPLCTGATLNLSTPIVAGATYSWTGPNGFTSAIRTPSITNVDPTDAGTYSVTITVGGCTSAAGSTTVVVNPLPATPTATNNGPLCTGATLNLSTPVVAGATYSWTGPGGFTSASRTPTIANVDPTDAGTYSVTVTVGGCTSAAGSTTVVVNPIPATPTATNNGPLCTGATLNLSTPVVAGATYSWTGPNGFTSTSRTPSIANVDPTDAGTYSVTITVGGCTSAAGSTTVVVNPLPATPTATNNGPLCTGATLNLTTPIVAGATYSWTGPNGFTSAVRTPSITNVTVAAAGTYNVTVTVSGCISAAGSTTVVVNPLPATPTATNNGPLCTGATLNLSTPIVAGATYSWTGPNGFTSAIRTPSITNVDPTDAGTYSVTITVGGCTSAAGSTTVVVNPLPATPTATNNGPLCTGAILNLSTPVVAGATYSWTGPNGFTAAVRTPSITNVTAAAGGTYNVTVTVSGCTSAAGSTTVVVNSLPAATITAGGPLTFCTGGSVTLTASAGASWLWSNGATTQAITVNTAGSYSVTVTNAAGCSAASAATVVTVNPLPATPTATNNGPLCTGATLNLSTPVVAGATYSWTGPNGFTSTSRTPSIANVDPTDAGTYSVTITVSGCTSAAGSTTVVVNPLPATPTATNNGPLCVGATLNLSTPVVAGATYSWTGPNGFISAVRTPSITNVTAAAAGTYSVTITVGGCTSAAGSTTVVVNPLPATPTASNNGPLCTGATLNLSTPVVAGATYSWTGPGGFTSVVRTPIITNVDPTDAGTYSVTITVGGCTSAAGSTTVVVNPLPATPTATNNGPLCTGATLNLSTPVVAGATYSWTGPGGFTSGVRTPSITNVDPTDAGTYTVTITVGGCTSAAGSTTVVVNPLPATPTATNNGPLCTGATLNLSTPVVAGATYSWTGPGGFTSVSRTPSIANVDPTDAGTYSVTVTVGNCTSAAGSTTVVVNPLPATPTATNNGPLCTGATLNLSTPVVAGATYAWTGPGGFTSASRTPTVANVDPTDAGTYSVTVTVGGCTSAAGSTTVVVNPLPATPTATNNGPLCTGATLNLSTPVVAGATYSWTGPGGFTSASRTPSIANVDPTDAGVYSVTITVSGCTSAAGSTTVIVNPLPATPTASNNGPLCTGATLNLSTPVVAGATYAWTGPGGFTSASRTPTVANVDPTDAGTYSVTVTVGNCTSAAGSTTVIVNPLPATPTASNNGPLCTGATLNLSTPVVAGATYAWTGPGGFTSAIRNPSIANVDPTDAGVYSVTITVGGCTSAAGSTTVVVNPLPATPAASNNGPLCTGATLNLSTPVVAGATYAWTGPGGFTSAIRNPTIANVTYRCGNI